MMQVKEIKQWLNTLDESEWIGIGEGGLTLETEDGEAYLEVGGLPDEEEIDPDELCECGRRNADCATYEDAECNHADRAQ